MACKPYCENDHRHAGLCYSDDLIAEHLAGVEHGDPLIPHRFASEFFLAEGSPNMNVNGAVTPRAFTISSNPPWTPNGGPAPKNKYASMIRIVLEGSNFDPTVAAQLRRFGPVAVPGLVHGLNITVIQDGTSVTLGPSNVKTLWELIAITDEYYAFPNGIAAGVDAFRANIRLPDPIALTCGSADHLAITIQDDLSALVGAYVAALGWYSF